MRDRPKIFWTNYNKVKAFGKKIERLPKSKNIKEFLYNFFKNIEQGRYYSLQSELSYSKGSKLREKYKIIDKTLDAYLKAYHASIPLELNESFRDIETDKKGLSELVESFKSRDISVGGGYK